MGCKASMSVNSHQSQISSTVVLARAWYNLSTRMENHVLLLAMPGDKKSAQQEAKTCDGTPANQNTCPICIKISMELERRPRGVVDTVFTC